MDVFDAKLEGGVAAVVVLDDGVADVERVAGFDVVIELGHAGRLRQESVERLLLVDQPSFMWTLTYADLRCCHSSMTFR